MSKNGGLKIKLPLDKLEIGDKIIRIYTGFKAVLTDGEILVFDAQHKLRDGSLISCKPNVVKDYFNSDNEGHLYVEIKKLNYNGKPSIIKHGEQIAFANLIVPKKK